MSAAVAFSENVSLSTAPTPAVSGVLATTMVSLANVQVFTLPLTTGNADAAELAAEISRQIGALRTEYETACKRILEDVAGCTVDVVSHADVQAAASARAPALFWKPELLGHVRTGFGMIVIGGAY